MIFDDLNEMKKYCKSVRESLRYLDRGWGIGNRGIILSGDKLIDEKFIKLENYQEGNYQEGKLCDDSNYYTYHYNMILKKYENIIEMYLWIKLNLF